MVNLAGAAVVCLVGPVLGVPAPSLSSIVLYASLGAAACVGAFFMARTTFIESVKGITQPSVISEKARGDAGEDGRKSAGGRPKGSGKLDILLDKDPRAIERFCEEHRVREGYYPLAKAVAENFKVSRTTLWLVCKRRHIKLPK
jgi:hypothetical protein